MKHKTFDAQLVLYMSQQSDLQAEPSNTALCTTVFHSKWNWTRTIPRNFVEHKPNPCSQSRVEPNLEAKESMRLTPCTALVLAQVQRNRAKKEASTPLARNSLPWLLFSEPLHNLTFLLHPQELLSLDQKTYLEKEIWSSLSLPSIPVLQITTSKPHHIYLFQYSDQLF